MGRGLSQQQREILAAGVAINAARNGGAPQPAIVLIDEPAGVEVETMFGARTRRHRCVMTADTPELTDALVLVAFGGFVRAGVNYSDATRWYRGDHKKRVSLCRAIKALLRRDLIARAIEPRRVYWLRDARADRHGWSDDERLAAETHERLRADASRFWGRWSRYSTPAYTLLPQAFDAVGDSWRHVDASRLLKAFEHAEGFDASREWQQRRDAARAAQALQANTRR
jgi:hypothetical protein